jgi:putative membrane protein
MGEKARVRAHALTTLAFVVGLALGAALLLHYGIGAVLELIGRAGWGLVPVALVHVGQLVAAGLGWRDATRPDVALGRTGFVGLRALREGINGLFSVLAVGGIVASVRVMLRRRLTLADAVASVATDISVEMVTQVAFTLLGIALLVLLLGTGALTWWMALGVTVLVAAVAAFLPAQWMGLARLAEFAARRLGWSEPVAGLHEAIMARYRAHGRLARAAVWHMVAWLLGGLEVWLVLGLLGAPVDLAQATVIESLALAVKGAAVFVPGALGVQEGGFVIVCALFGLAPETALALSLIKRLRDIVFGVPSLALWLAMERRGRATPGIAAATPLS